MLSLSKAAPSNPAALIAFQSTHRISGTLTCGTASFSFPCATPPVLSPHFLVPITSCHCAMRNGHEGSPCPIHAIVRSHAQLRAGASQIPCWPCEYLKRPCYRGAAIVKAEKEGKGGGGGGGAPHPADVQEEVDACDVDALPQALPPAQPLLLRRCSVQVLWSLPLRSSVAGHPDA